MFKIVAGLLGLLLVLLPILFGLGLLALSIYGLILAAKASLVLLIVVLLLEPSPLILGILGLAGHPEVAGQIARWLHLV